MYTRKWEQSVVQFAKDLQRYTQSRRPDSSLPFDDLTGTIPSFHCSISEAVNGGTVHGVVPAGGLLGNGR